MRFPCLNEFHNLFYKNGLKCLPLNIKELLTPIGLGQVIMGDGYFHNQTVLLCTENYSLDEVKLLIETLEIKFGLKASPNKRLLSNGKIGWIIRISVSSLDKLITIVSPHIIPKC